MAEESNKEYSVNWKNHMIYVRKAFDHLLASSELVDVTLFCEGKKLRAHKVLLSACSGYFREIFKEVPSCPHPVFILNGVEFEVLSDILRFVYNGEVSVDTARLDSFLKTAQMLQISGLTDTNSEKSESEKSEITSRVAPSQSSETPPTETPITAAPVPTEQPPVKKSVKRQATKEPEEQQPEKVFRNEDNDMYLTDVKCEPNELINFEDPLEDPLQSDLMQQGDDKDFVIASGTRQLGEEEFKPEPSTSQKHCLEFLPRKKDGGMIRRRCYGCYRNIKSTSPSTVASHSAKKVSTECRVCQKAFCLPCFNYHHFT